MSDRMEEMAEAVHKAYCDNYKQSNGQEYWTGGDYSKLPEHVKEIDRDTVRAIIPFFEADLAKARKRIKELQEFAIWMTGCGYDFCQHKYFCEQRDRLLKKGREDES